MTDILETYKSFLEELIHSDCTIKGETKNDRSATQRKDRLQKMIQSIDDTEDGERTRAFVDFFESVSKYVGRTVTDSAFWDKFCEVLQKKPGRAHKLFFLNQPSESKDVNIGSIALNQTSHNSRQIRNFVFILYCHLCKQIYGEKFPKDTHDLYNDILKVFDGDEKEEEPFPDLTDLLQGGVLDSYKDIFERVSTMNGRELADLVFSNENMMVTTMLQNFLGGGGVSLEGMREDLEKLTNDDVKSIVDKLKSRIDTMDINGLLQSVQQMDPAELQAKLGELLASVQE